jgi:hypothetical protein
MLPRFGEALTFERIPPSLVKKVLLVAVVGDMADTFPEDLSQWVNLEPFVLNSQVVVAFSFVWGIVDYANNLVAFREDWGIFGYLLSSGERHYGAGVGYRSSRWRLCAMVTLWLTAERIE